MALLVVTTPAGPLHLYVLSIAETVNTVNTYKTVN
jgi:hypothetical protein